MIIAASPSLRNDIKGCIRVFDQRAVFNVLPDRVACAVVNGSHIFESSLSQDSTCSYPKSCTIQRGPLRNEILDVSRSASNPLQRTGCIGNGTIRGLDHGDLLIPWRLYDMDQSYGVLVQA